MGNLGDKLDAITEMARKTLSTFEHLCCEQRGRWMLTLFCWTMKQNCCKENSLMNSQKLPGIVFRPNLIQATVIIISAIWVIFSFVSDITIFKDSLYLKELGLEFYAFSIPMTFIEAVLPFVLVIWFHRKIHTYLKQNPRSISFFRYMWNELEKGMDGLLIIFAIPLIVLSILLDMYFSFSVLPLSLPFCGLLWILISYWMLRYLKPEHRIVVLAISLSLILSVKYFDWNSRKVFERDLLRISAEMTAIEVNTIMSRYMTYDDLPASMMYRHSDTGPFTADQGIVSFQDGKVEKVTFSAD
jgi:hypothetical protein